MPAGVVVILLAILGACVGSFLNVCIYRLPRRESLAWPASHCTRCNRSLSWYENVPIASWVALSGRCRTCRAPISWMYPIVEITTALVFVIGYELACRHGDSIARWRAGRGPIRPRRCRYVRTG